MLLVEPTLEDLLTLSTGYNTQVSMVPFVNGLNGLFTWATGGPSSGQMWLSFTWSATTLTRADQSTLSLAAPPSALAAPSVTTFAGGALGARTLFARIAYVRSDGDYYSLYAVSAEQPNIAVGANNLLQVNSPADPGGGQYAGWIPLVGSAANGEKVQLQTVPIPFGTNWQEPSGGFDTTQTPYSTSWKSPGVTLIQIPANPQIVYAYPYLHTWSMVVRFPVKGAITPGTAIVQNGDGNAALTSFILPYLNYSAGITMPAANNTGSGTGGGGRWT
ncbi:MAG TPA: hypothetical protein VKQ05_12950 [Gemmatimonadales bacterium]|nr:hypothetical protein [Gemmatimonadales bacterium]